MSRPTLDLDRYLAIPRLGGLDVSADGSHLVFAVQRMAPDGKKFVSDLWRAPITGPGPAERMTRGDASDHSPRCRDDGSVLFLSDRPDPELCAEDRADTPDPVTALWLLPATGDARALTVHAAGLSAFAVARRSGGAIFRADVFPGAANARADRELGRARKKSGTSALLYDDLPVRYWDKFLGPRHPHLFHLANLDRNAEIRDLTPEATIEHDDLGFDVSPDGRFAVAAERERSAHGDFHENLRLFDLQEGTSRLLTNDGDSYGAPRFAPDGQSVVAVRHEIANGKAGRQWLVLLPLAAGATARPLTIDLDLWPDAPVFSPDGRFVYFVADERGAHAVLRVAVADATVDRITLRGSFVDVVPAADGAAVYAIASSTEYPPEVVALPPAAAPAVAPRRVTFLTESHLSDLACVHVESLVAKTKDGREVQSWLTMPDSAPPAAGFPVLLWIHGGPLGAWSDGWHWRWNPHLFAARGYAVLAVNPRISTGFGQAFIEEGHGRWGAEPFEDLMAALDGALERPDLDGSRQAAMGGSFGGYMANWIAGRTARFRCIVSHAGLWELRGFHGTTDFGVEWEREFGGDPYRHPEVYERWSPHHAVRDIQTPMLVIHGEKDYRVPVSEAYQLFTALKRLEVPAQLLYFPDENHWILRPPNIRVWHETIWAWLDRWLA